MVLTANDCWFRDAYKGSIVFSSDAKVHDVDRSDTVYPKPHWDGMFVILVDDGDVANPPDREGRVQADRMTKIRFEGFGTRHVGKAQVRAGLASRFSGVPDVHYGNDEHWVCGDQAMSRWVLTGTTRDGRSLNVRGCDLWEFRDGACIRKDSYWKIVDP